MRVGVIDMGTNSTRILLADVQDGELHELERGIRVPGEGVHHEPERVRIETAHRLGEINLGIVGLGSHGF